MNRKERMIWAVVWLLCHTIGVSILTTAVFVFMNGIGAIVGLFIMILSVVVIISVTDVPEGDNLSNTGSPRIPNELKQAIVNVDMRFIDEALRSHNPGQMEIALEHCKAIFKTILGMAKVILQ